MAPLTLPEEVQRRRTFAIISHPDAGKTTLTEKLLLYGGAIHLAGAVKAKKNQKFTTSDWMEIEKQRGISISTTVLQFDYSGTRINLLDTPGHKDFSEDTYRTLMAVDAAVMLIDASKGVEPQTRKLFEVCRMRGLPIFTFVNKMDRPAREPMDLMDELEKVLGIRSCPMTWPIGSGDRFRGVYDRVSHEVLVFQNEGQANATDKIEAKKITDFDSEEFYEILKGPHKNEADADALLAQFKTELELVEIAGDSFDRDEILKGHLTPIFFGSAMNNFGVERFLERFIEIAPSPTPRTASGGEHIDPLQKRFSAFIFKIQANMDPRHRDRVAFMRICSGKFEKNMTVKHARLDRDTRLARPLNFFANERVIIEEGFPGDILGVVDTSGDLRIGDTLCQGAKFEYTGIPSFLPEYFSSVVILDPMKRKQLKKGLEQLSEEGVVQIFTRPGAGEREPVLGAVGALQFEVLQSRLKNEYDVDIRLEALGYTHLRWVHPKSGQSYDWNFFERREDSRPLVDRDQNPVLLFKNDWALRWAQDNYSNLELLTTAPLKRV